MDDIRTRRSRKAESLFRYRLQMCSGHTLKQIGRLNPAFYNHLYADVVGTKESPLEGLK